MLAFAGRIKWLHVWDGTLYWLPLSEAGRVCLGRKV
jgi:hypothetical protein